MALSEIVSCIPLRGLHFISVNSPALPPAAIRTVSLLIRNSEQQSEEPISLHSSLSSSPLQKTKHTGIVQPQCTAMNLNQIGPHMHGWFLRKENRMKKKWKEKSNKYEQASRAGLQPAIRLSKSHFPPRNQGCRSKLQTVNDINPTLVRGGNKRTIVIKQVNKCNLNYESKSC